MIIKFDKICNNWFTHFYLYYTLVLIIITLLYLDRNQQRHSLTEIMLQLKKILWCAFNWELKVNWKS